MLTIRQAVEALFAKGRFRQGKAGPFASPAVREEGPPPSRITVVGLLADDHDRQLLAAVCNQTQWDVLFAETCEEALTTLDNRGAPVILYDRDLPGREWRDVVAHLASTAHRACVILISRMVDDYLWNEVVHTGGYDVLPKPLRQSDILRVIRLAWSYWNSAAKPATVAVKRR